MLRITNGPQALILGIFAGIGLARAPHAEPLPLSQAPAEATLRCTEAVSGITTVSGMPAGTGFASAYNPQAWSGYLFAHRVFAAPSAAHPPAIEPHPDWGVTADRPWRPHRTTADRLDALPGTDGRLILSHNGEHGVPFRWTIEEGTQLSRTQQGMLQPPDRDADHGPRLLDYLRGARTHESASAASGFRPRASRQGDIVHSRIWHVGRPAAEYAEKSYREFAARHANRPAMLYVGGNDGMLHGFAAATGEEIIAYVPQGVYRHLPLLADPAYTHRYLVDGSPFTGDVDLGTTLGAPAWKTLLMGTLGAGGPGYFLLDVTDLGSDRFRESLATDLVVMDRTDGSDPDIGHIFAHPTPNEANARRTLQITRTNNRRWAAIVGNGYNSRRERPVLLVQYLDGLRELLKMEAVPTGPEEPGNGLSAPQFLDVNGDGIPDFVYAGDLQGNLWKFDIAAASDSRWHVANQGAALYSAARDGRPQPITAAPVLRVHPQAGGLLVAFGTGRDLTDADRSDHSVQSVYAIMDYTRYALAGQGVDQGKVVIDASLPRRPTAPRSRSELMEQKLRDGDRPAGPSYGSVQSTPFAYCVETPCSADQRKGWYVDLPQSRERVLQSLRFPDGGQVLEIISQVPAQPSSAKAPQASPATAPALAQPCEDVPGSARTYRTWIHIATGAPSQARTMDADGDGRITGDDGHVVRSTAPAHEIRLTTRTGEKRIGLDGQGDTTSSIPTIMLRPGWRHLK